MSLRRSIWKAIASSQIRALPLCLLAGFATASVSGGEYCVVSLVPKGDPYEAAVDELRETRKADVLSVEAASIETTLPELRRLAPRHVAVVVKPGDFDVNLARTFLQLATRVDDDPFVDFAYGFITGATASEAVQLVRAGQVAEPIRLPDSVLLAVGNTDRKESTKLDADVPLREARLKRTMHLLAPHTNFAGPRASFNSEARDSEYLAEWMPTLDRVPMIVFAGHGYPREVVGGPAYEHVSERHWDGAVVLNIACFSGVTDRWFDTDWQSGQTVERRVPASESLCLNVLGTGVAGYVAYTCQRPSGPTMLAESITIATSGESLGELRRRRTNEIIMAHLQLGSNQLAIRPFNDGDQVRRDRTVQQLLTEISTGGVLFGDPACRPYVDASDLHPSQTTIASEGKVLKVRVEIRGRYWHQFCADQIMMLGDNTATNRVETVIELGDRYATEAKLTTCNLGVAAFSDHRLIAVTENHRGQRFLHLKVSYPQSALSRFMAGALPYVYADFEVLTGDEPAESFIVHRDGLTDER